MRRLIVLLLGLAAICGIAALAGRVCCAAGTPPGETITLQVEGMTCGACATSVKIVLEKLDGVSDAKVSLKDKQAVVTYDPAKVTPEKMVEAVNANLPYKAKVAGTGKTK